MTELVVFGGLAFGLVTLAANATLPSWAEMACAIGAACCGLAAGTAAVALGWGAIPGWLMTLGPVMGAVLTLGIIALGPLTWMALRRNRWQWTAGIVLGWIMVLPAVAAGALPSGQIADTIGGAARTVGYGLAGMARTQGWL